MKKRVTFKKLPRQRYLKIRENIFTQNKTFKFFFLLKISMDKNQINVEELFISLLFFLKKKEIRIKNFRIEEQQNHENIHGEANKGLRMSICFPKKKEKLSLIINSSSMKKKKKKISDFNYFIMIIILSSLAHSFENCSLGENKDRKTERKEGRHDMINFTLLCLLFLLIFIFHEI